MVAFCRDSFAQVIAWCQSVAALGPVEVIIRPRPATPASEFTAAVERAIPGQRLAVRIIKDETVREWILASDLVVSSYSTSLIEAAVAGVANAMLEPVPLINALRVDWQDHAARLTSEAAFRAACLAQTGAPHDTRLGQWARSHMMAHGDAVSNLANHLAGLVQRPPAKNAALRRRLLAPAHPRWQPAWVAFELSRRRGAQHRRTAQPVTTLYERDVVSSAEISARTQRWQALLGAPPPLAPADRQAPRPQPNLT
jgi:hypothetical protein